MIIINNGNRANTGSGKIHDHRRAKPASTNNKHPRRQ